MSPEPAHSAEYVAPWDGLTPPYRTLVVDPPWRYKSRMVVTGNAPGRTKQKGSSGTNYETMSIEEIAALSVADLVHPDGSHLYLWTTNAHLKYAWGIVHGWGFTPKNLLTWCKAPKGMIGFGTFSPASEFVLFAASGKRAINIGRADRTWFEWPRKRHSEKPGGFFDLVESVSPGPFVELFARRKRLGWDGWGDEYGVAS